MIAMEYFGIDSFYFHLSVPVGQALLSLYVPLVLIYRMLLLL